MDKYTKFLVIPISIIIFLLVLISFYSRFKPKPVISIHYVIININNINDIQTEVNKAIAKPEFNKGDSLVFIDNTPNTEQINNLVDLYYDNTTIN